MKQRAFCMFALLVIFLTLTAPLHAQQASQPVTDDAVNAVAKKMYCPVCKNIPLDVCGTAACAQWREEIRSELQAGKTQEQIIADFVNRYGDRVVGVPEDPGLNALSLITPWLISLAAVVGGGLVFFRWRANRRAAGLTPAPIGANHAAMSDDEYRARLEADLQKRR